MLVGDGYGTVGRYDATTGAAVNVPFITGFYTAAGGMAFDGSGHLFVTNYFGGAVGEYDATTGATINAAFVSGQGLEIPDGIVFVAPVPEPSSLLLLAATAAVGIGIRRRRRRGRESDTVTK